MNETILTKRQKEILNLVGQADGVSREEIHIKLADKENIAKPTLIRDLNILVAEKLVKVEGKASKTRYFSTEDNPLLRYFDLDSYFSLEPDQREVAKKSFDFSIFDHLVNLFSKLEDSEIKSIHKSFSEQVSGLSSDIYKKELERFVIEMSWKSSKIEGNTYSLLDTERLIEEREEAKGHSREEAIMILNHKRAFETILQNRQDFKRLSVSKINQLHGILVKDLGIGGGIRNGAVGITGTVYRPPDNIFQIQEVLEKTLDVINRNTNYQEKAFIASAMIPYIQPYSDGNKRTSRMLTNAILLAGDYFPVSYRSIDIDEYKKAMILFYEQGSLYHLKKIFLEQLNFAHKNYFL